MLECLQWLHMFLNVIDKDFHLTSTSTNYVFNRISTSNKSQRQSLYFYLDTRETT